MPDWHYHANHIDAPARGSKAAAMKDARRLHVNLYNAAEMIDTAPISYESIKEHGIEFPLIVKCFRQDCQIQKVAATQEP